MTTRLQAVELAKRGKLLPCPFCGDDNERPTMLLEPRLYVNKTLRAGFEKHKTDPDAYAYAVTCGTCAAMGPWSKSSERAAMVAWNCRIHRPKKTKAKRIA